MQFEMFAMIVVFQVWTGCRSRGEVVVWMFAMIVVFQVWTGCRSRGEVVVWDALSLDMIERIRVDCRGISKMVQVQDKVSTDSTSNPCRNVLPHSNA